MKRAQPDEANDALLSSTLAATQRYRRMAAAHDRRPLPSAAWRGLAERLVDLACQHEGRLALATSMRATDAHHIALRRAHQEDEVLYELMARTSSPTLFTDCAIAMSGSEPGAPSIARAKRRECLRIAADVLVPPSPARTAATVQA